MRPYLIDGTNVNHSLVKDGWCWWDQKICTGGYGAGKGWRRKHERCRKGLWVDPQPVPPWEWRKRKSRSYQAYCLALARLASACVREISLQGLASCDPSAHRRSLSLLLPLDKLLQYSFLIHHGNPRKKVDEFGGLSSDCVPVFSCRRLL